ncbi:218_t:CDS:2 [Funneliformis mosseae]|uniref:218_t:CDS:1 n=1 Tax=Funneliformis mosseae TaxID=27381 RepID=A0A9N9CLA9_FUNMO|nr:218_t:CDS:2 [Funneliformis mosseae]
MALGFCFDVMKVTSGRMMLTGSKSSATLKDRNEGIEGYWQSRRKAYQEMVDKLYTGYMERLIGVQQQQAQYWEHSQYMYSQPRYQNQNGDVYVDDHRNADDRNYETNSDGMSEGSSFMPDIKITEDTSATIME